MSDTKNAKKQNDIVHIRVNDLDRLNVLVLSEGIHRVQAQIDATQLRLEKLQAELLELGAKEKEVLNSTWRKYEMKAEDSFDMTSGLITRSKSIELKAS